MNNDLILRLKDVRRSYSVGDGAVEVLRAVNWELERGRWACLLGASGSGKTTLLHLIGALEKPDAGTIEVAGVDLSKLSRIEAAEFRNNRLGFVFQAYHLLPELNIRENVMLPGMLAGKSRKECRQRAEMLLELVGLKERMHHRPNELSGGEQQRAAIARALINDPELLLADEPTGNLDARTGAGILELFGELRRERPDRTIVMITHNREIAELCDPVVQLCDGVFVS